MAKRKSVLVGMALLLGLAVVVPQVLLAERPPEVIEDTRAQESIGDPQVVSEATAPRSMPGTRARILSPVLEEDFSSETFPPTGWSHFKLAGDGDQEWQRVTASFNSPPASAHRRYSFSADGFQDDWLVTPPLDLEGLSDAWLVFFDTTTFMAWYGYHGVWVSTVSCDPNDGDFVELEEMDAPANYPWREMALSLAAFEDDIICLAFVYQGEDAASWWIDDVVVGEVMEIPEPEIEVTPASLAASQLADTVTEQILTIGNTGGTDLVWEFDDGSSSWGLVLWDQPVNGTSGIVSDFFIGSDAGAYSASDFVLAAPATIDYIFAAGFDASNTLASQPAINWAIYADAGGVPAGHPEDGTDMASALWSYSSAVDGPGVDITDNNIALDLVAAGQAQSLSAGTYWLTVYPSYDVTGAGGPRWNWYQAAQVGAETHLVSPVVFGVANWTSLSGLGVTFTDTAFRLESSVPCDNPADVPWLNVAPASGTTAPDGSTPVTVSFDSTGLAIGLYEAYVCVVSNDEDNSLVVVPIELEVVPPPTATVTVEVGPGGGGTVSGGGVYNTGDVATVEAFPAFGWVFLYWEINGQQITDNPYTFEVTGDITLTAIFEQQEIEAIPTMGMVGIGLLLALLAGVGVFVLRRM